MLKAVDLFCGAGGFTVGLTNAGIDVCLGLDINAEAVAVYNANHDHPAVVHDISDVLGTIELIRNVGTIDIVAGSSPCQEFSLSGKQQEGELASLTLDFGKVVRAVHPNVFVLENVPNIVHSEAYKLMQAMLIEAGYSITVLVMNSKYCRTAQCRRRAIVCGVLGGGECLHVLQTLAQASQKEHKALPPTTIRHVLGTERCGDTIYFAPRNRFYPAVLSTDRVYPTLRSHRGKCIERPPSKYKPRYEDAGPIDEAFVMEPVDAARIASFPETYKWPCSREKAGAFIGNSVPPAMIAMVIGFMKQACVFDPRPSSSSIKPGLVTPTSRVRKQIESHIEMFWGGKQPLNIGETITEGPPRIFSYVQGTSIEGDARIQEVLKWTPLPGWRIEFKERLKQTNRVDDTFIYVPGYDIPFRGKRQLVVLGLLN